MTEAHRRKKNPELVRAALVESAIALAINQGLSNVGVDAVAVSAGVTRGGFFHHFPSKQDLVDAVFERLLDDFENALVEKIEADAIIDGRFTRAYLELSLETRREDVGLLALWSSAVVDSRLRAMWATRYKSLLERFAESEVGPEFEAVRYAADGVWQGILLGVTPADYDSFRRTLLELIKDRA